LADEFVDVSGAHARGERLLAADIGFRRPLRFWSGRSCKQIVSRRAAYVRNPPGVKETGGWRS